MKFGIDVECLWVGVFSYLCSNRRLSFFPFHSVQVGEETAPQDLSLSVAAKQVILCTRICGLMAVPPVCSSRSLVEDAPLETWDVGIRDA